MEMPESRAPSPQISIIVLNWNRAPLLERCLHSLDNQETLAHSEVIVVDNGSTDNSREITATKFPWVRLVASSRNLGFAAGNNLGAEYARGEIIFFLNNDAELAPACIPSLLRAFVEKPNAAVVGCTVRDLEERDVVQEAGMSIDRLGFPIPFVARRRGLPPFYVSGCALAIRRTTIDVLGLFDDRYFMFTEDVDLCWRAQLAGFEISVAADAIIYHQSGGTMTGGAARSARRYATSLRRVYLRERNTMATLIKNYESRSLIWVLPLYALLLTFEALLACAVLRFKLAWQYARAVAWNFKNLRETVRRRAIVQGHRLVPDKGLPFDARFGKLLAFRLVGIPRLES